jgi:hypothetical protein
VRHSTPEQQAELEARLLKLEQPIPLFRQGSTEPSVWVCGVCSHVVETEDRARRHYPCLPIRCGHGLRSGNDACHDCWGDTDAKRTEERLAKATRISEADWRAGKWPEGCPGEVFALDGEEVLADLEADELMGEEYAWPAESVPFALDAEKIVEDQLRDWGESVDWLDGDLPDACQVEELVAFVAKWNAAQTAVYLRPLYSHVIVLERGRERYRDEEGEEP